MDSQLSETPYLQLLEERRKEKVELLKRLQIFNQSPAQSSKKRSAKLKYEKLVPARKSLRLLGKEPRKYSLDDEDVYSAAVDESKSVAKTERKKAENVFGAIPGIAVGTLFSTRLEASNALVHRPTVAGIHGNPLLGCYSLALSGGYEDDIDNGHSFTYTGEGGRDLKGTKANPKNLRTAPQSKDQVLERGNLALSKNVENKLPVRVLRGYKLKSQYAPDEGYRYDGVYKVKNYYATTGKSGFNVYKFELERIAEQEPAPWLNQEKDKDEENLPSTQENTSGKRTVKTK